MKRQKRKLFIGHPQKVGVVGAESHLLWLKAPVLWRELRNRRRPRRVKWSGKGPSLL